MVEQHEVEEEVLEKVLFVRKGSVSPGGGGGGEGMLAVTVPVER